MITSAPTVKESEQVSFGLVESASVNSITDFIPSKSKGHEVKVDMEKEDFINTFICHFIFYLFFCVSIVLHILIDLGLGSFLKKSFNQLIGITNKRFFENKPAFA